jgi:hypothetical protein
MVFVAIVTIFSVYVIPIIFMLAFAVPSLTIGAVSIAIGFLAWTCSCFLISSFFMLVIPLPYDETLPDKASEAKDDIT